MSLLLDARKKIELALEQSGAHSAIEPQLSETMRHEDLPTANVPQKKRDNPSQNTRAAPAGGAPVGASPLRSDPVTAGKNLFAAKAAPARRHLGIIPIALISGLVLAAGGGYYVWREISPPPMAQRKNPVTPPATPIANASPPAAPAPQPTPILAAKDKPALANADVRQSNSEGQSNRAHIVTDTAMPHNATTTAAQPIRIEHKQESDVVDPTLLAAWQAYRNGDLRTAWQHYSDVLHNDAKNRDALLGMAAIAQQQSQDAIAAHYYGQVLVLDPRDPIAHAGMSALFGATNAAGTESRLKLLLAQQPRSAALHLALGNHYAEQSRWGDAQQAFFNAYNIDSGNAQFAFNLAVSLDHLGQGKLAAQYYQHALQLDTSDSAGFDRAQTQQRLKQLSAGSY